VGQLAKQSADQQGGQFSANTQTNLKELNVNAPSRKEVERQFIRFTKILKSLQINIHFTEALQQMPTYSRFVKELLTKKRKFLKE